MCRGRRRESSANYRLDIIRKKRCTQKTQTAFAFPPKWRRQSGKRNSLPFSPYQDSPLSPNWLQKKEATKKVQLVRTFFTFPPSRKESPEEEKETKTPALPFLLPIVEFDNCFLLMVLKSPQVCIYGLINFERKNTRFSLLFGKCHTSSRRPRPFPLLLSRGKKG